MKLTDAIGFAWLLKRFVCRAKPVVSHRMENMGRQNGTKHIYYYKVLSILWNLLPFHSTMRTKHFNFMQTNCKFVLGQNKQKTFSKRKHFFFWWLLCLLHPKPPGETQKVKCLSKHWQTLDKRNLYTVYLMHHEVESCKVITTIRNDKWCNMEESVCVCGEIVFVHKTNGRQFSHRLAN